MKFKKEDLIDIAYDDHDPKIYEVIENEVCNHSRWSVGHSVIFKVLETGKFYSTYYSVGATEMQCEEAYEYADAEIECTEVIPKKVEVIQYVPVSQESTTD